MFTTGLAAGGLTNALGDVTADGLGVVLLVTLIYGVIGRGKKTLASGPAQLVGIWTELAFLRSHSAVFLAIGQGIQSVPTSLAANPKFHLGMPIVCLILIILSLFARIVPVSGAVLGLLMGAAFSAASGSLWQALVYILLAPFDLLGA